MPSLPRSSRSRSARSSSIRSRRPSREQPASRSRSRRRRSTSPHHRIRSPHARPSASHPNRKRMGMNVYDNPTRIGKFDFEEKYPEDPVYEELGPNARAWRVNLDECEVYDNDMVIEARDGLDLLLVFAGLFSAVLTTFVAQTSQALSNNFPAVSTSLLLEMVTLQRALINGTPIDDISSSEMTSGPSGFDVWVNALWFTSLTLSLGTALMAVLVKQWLYQYMSITSGTARDRSLIRFYRFNGLRKWHVLTIISTLPIVLHIALGLFLAGLVIFLIPLNIHLASVVGSISLVVYTMYTVSNILPIIYTQCPYRTPFSDILNILMRPIFTSIPARALRVFFVFAVVSTMRLYRLFSTTIFDLFDASPETSDPSTSPNFPTLKEAERIAATGDGVAEGIACDALLWLYQMTSNPPTKSIVLQSLGCLSNNISNRLAVLNTDLQKALDDVIHKLPTHQWSIRPGQESRAGRLLRAQRHVQQRPVYRNQWKVDAEAPFHILASILTYKTTGSVLLGEEKWTSYDFLMHIIQEYNAGHLVCLPSIIWQELRMVRVHRDFSGYRNNKLLLCRLALHAMDNVKRTPPPFHGGVLITDATVPLHHIVTGMLPHNDLPSSERLRQLCTISDYIVSELSTDKNLVTDDAISVLLSLWNRIPVPNCCTGNSQTICLRAEKCILEIFVGDLWGRLSDTNALNWCYSSVIDRYWQYCGHGSVPSLELFNKLFSEVCGSSAVVADMSGRAISHILEHAFSLDIDGSAAYYTLFCGLESPLFSPWTKLSLYVSINMGCAMSAFVNGLARGFHPQALTRHCMEFLCAEPDRLFTVCRILALEKADLWSDIKVDERKQSVAENLSKLVHLYPEHDAWQHRTHYLIGIEPWNWPYFSIPKNYRNIRSVQPNMQFALNVLDDLFTSLENLSTPPHPELQFGPAIRQSSMDLLPEPLRIASRWRRVRLLVSSIRAFRRSSSPLAGDIELATAYLPDQSNRMPVGESLHIEPAPPSPILSKVAGPSQSDDMV